MLETSSTEVLPRSIFLSIVFLFFVCLFFVCLFLTLVILNWKSPGISRKKMEWPLQYSHSGKFKSKPYWLTGKINYSVCSTSSSKLEVIGCPLLINDLSTTKLILPIRVMHCIINKQQVSNIWSLTRLTQLSIILRRTSHAVIRFIHSNIQTSYSG